LPGYAGLVRNLPELEAAAAGCGNIALAPEIDGIVRRVPLVLRIGHDLHPALTVELLRVATGQEAYAVRADAAGMAGLVVANVPVPTDRDGQVFVRFAPSDPRRFVSAADVPSGTVRPARRGGRA